MNSRSNLLRIMRRGPFGNAIEWSKSSTGPFITRTVKPAGDSQHAPCCGRRAMQRSDRAPPSAAAYPRRPGQRNSLRGLGHDAGESILRTHPISFVSAKAHCSLAESGLQYLHAISNSPHSIRRRMGGQLPFLARLSFPRRDAGRSRGKHQSRHPGMAESGGGGIRSIEGGRRPRRRLSHAQTAWHQPCDCRSGLLEARISCRSRRQAHGDVELTGAPDHPSAQSHQRFHDGRDC